MGRDLPRYRGGYLVMQVGRSFSSASSSPSALLRYRCTLLRQVLRQHLWGAAPSSLLHFLFSPCSVPKCLTSAAASSHTLHAWLAPSSSLWDGVALHGDMAWPLVLLFFAWSRQLSYMVSCFVDPSFSYKVRPALSSSFLMAKWAASSPSSFILQLRGSVPMHPRSAGRSAALQFFSFVFSSFSAESIDISLVRHAFRQWLSCFSFFTLQLCLDFSLSSKLHQMWPNNT